MNARDTRQLIMGVLIGYIVLMLLTDIPRKTAALTTLLCLATALLVYWGTLAINRFFRK